MATPVFQQNFLKIPPFIKNQAVNLQNKFTRMPQRIFLVVVVFTLLFCEKIFSQPKNVENIFSTKQNHSIFLKKSLAGKSLSQAPFSPSFLTVRPHILKPAGYFSKTLPGIKNYTPLREDYYFDNLGFFCRKEWQVEKATSFPLRFRLGSIDYTDYMEGKPNAILRR